MTPLTVLMAVVPGEDAAINKFYVLWMTYTYVYEAYFY